MIKIHIDNIDNEDGRVWAVQDGKKYYRVHEISTFHLNLETKISKKQPRAFLQGKGIVKIIKKSDGILVALIDGIE